MSNYLKIYSSLDRTTKRDHKFWLRKIEGEEGICQEFEFKLKVNTLERLADSEIQDLLGDSLTVEIGYLDSKSKPNQRYINGLIYEITELGLSKAPNQPDVWQYNFEIGSWFRQLEYVKDCRIFQKNGNNTAKIVTELLAELGFHDFKDKMGSKLPSRPYSVIYNETLSNYIRRLCLDDGIIWYYEHSKTKHELVFHKDSTELPEIDVSESPQDSVKSFCLERTHIPIQEYTLSAFEWEKPPVKNVKKVVSGSSGNLPYFSYSENFITREDGTQKAERQTKQLKSQQTRFYGESTMRPYTAGYKFILHAPPLPEHHQKQFVIKYLKIEATEERYENNFVALPANQPYLPAANQNIEHPIIPGTQTALVVGAAGKGGISSNKKGQVKVKFHWDHRSKDNDAHTSAFIRVSNPAAGSQRGFVFTPRIGEEVVVSYEDGNPDRPIILGGVHSSNRPVPAMGKPESLVSKMFSMSGSGGSHSYSSPVSQGYAGTIKSDEDSDSNRITFNDDSSEENLEINAKKDLNIDVGGNLNIEVDEDIYIITNQENINVTNNAKSQAGGSIINATLAATCNTAGIDISHMALGGIINVAGGVISNLAGATITNTAILSVKNEATGALNQKADTLIANTCMGAVLNMAEKVDQEGDLAVTNISLTDIMNNAEKEIKTKALFQKVKTSDESTTDTGDYVLKGLLPKIN